MSIWRVVVMSCHIVCFQGLFQSLMAEEGSIEPVAIVVRQFGNLQVFGGNTQPLPCNIFPCHSTLFLVIRWQRYEVSVEYPNFGAAKSKKSFTFRLMSRDKIRHRQIFPSDFSVCVSMFKDRFEAEPQFRSLMTQKQRSRGSSLSLGNVWKFVFANSYSRLFLCNHRFPLGVKQYTKNNMHGTA